MEYHSVGQETGEKCKAAAFQEDETQFRILIEDAPDAVYLHDLRGQILYANPKACRDLGYSPAELQVMEIRAIDSTDPDPESMQLLWNKMKPGSCITLERLYRRKDGRCYPVEIQLSQIFHAGEKRFLAFARDISGRKQAEEQLRHQATHDQLTGLANRTLLEDRLEQSIHYAHRSQQLIGVLLLDLDDFKIINDNFGHIVGDEVLCRVAQRLKQDVREADTVARLGGDEFVILLADVTKEDDAGLVAKKILANLAQPFQFDEREITMTASIGISLYPRDGSDSETLLRNADMAMYRSKEDNGIFHFYSPKMEQKMAEVLEIETDLRRALERGELVLHYQPKVDMQTGKITGAEALLRWQHPQRGLVGPNLFMPYVEETGLILPIGEWVLATACAQIRTWQRQGINPISVSVNLTAGQLRKADLIDTISRLLQQNEVAPHLLELELTESMIMRDPQAVSATLQQLKELGVSLVLDDFGTGYSSLNELRSFPVDCLNIDRSFISEVTRDPSAAAVANSIVAIANSLGLRTVAEGVETKSQFDFVRGCGCETLQGFYFSKPLLADAFASLLEQGQQATQGVEDSWLSQEGQIDH